MRIVVRQMSGLGNQLFQYAAGVYFALRYGATLTIAADPDPTAASLGSPRPFQLSTYQLTSASHVRPANKLEQVLLTFRPCAQGAAEILRTILGTPLFVEPEPFHFYPDLPFRGRPRVFYLRAYWQAAGYAAGVEAQLRREFTLKDPPTGRNLEVLNQIAASACPVSLHIRRGDYLLGKDDLSLSLRYYHQALEIVRGLHATPELFVFSDDMEYARQNLPRDLPLHFVDHNDNFTAYEDLRLMSACRHHIIANSSFSWWGAWLNPRPEKLVIAPRNWAGNKPSFHPDLYPGGWKIIDNPPHE